MEKLNCWIVIDKRLGMTSTQVLGKVRKILNTKKVGHLGTLDPLATGVLPIAIGEATKTIPFIYDHTKVYEFSVIFGIESETGDMEGVDIENMCDSESVSESDIKDILPDFHGKITQIPPKFSAVKINGVPAYKLARAGKEVEIKSREVEIYDLEFLGIETHTVAKATPLPRGELLKLDSKHCGNDEIVISEAKFRVKCSAGTYVRSLAMDICKKLGVKGVVSSIRRLQSGIFKIEDAILLENLENGLYNEAKSKKVDVDNNMFLSLNEVLADIPGLVLNHDNISLLQHGQFVESECLYPLIRVLDSENKLQLIGKCEGGFLKPLRIFNN